MSGSSGTGKSGTRHHYYRTKAMDLSLDADALEAAVLQKLRSSFENDDELESCLSQVKECKLSQLDIIDSQVRVLKTQFKDLEKQERELDGVLGSGGMNAKNFDWLNGRIDAIRKGREDLGQKLDKLARERNHLEKTKVEQKSVRKALSRAFFAFDQATPIRKRAFLREIFKEVRVFRDNRVQLTWAVPQDLSAVTSREGGGLGLSSVRIGGPSDTTDQLQKTTGDNSGGRPDHRAYIIDIFEHSLNVQIDFERQFKKLFLDEANSLSQISERYSVSREYVRKILENSGVTEFDSNRPGYLTGTVPYGWKKQNGALIPHLAEQRVIEEMHRLRLCEKSLRMIAQNLNSKGLKTKEGKTWHPQSVKRALAHNPKNYQQPINQEKNQCSQHSKNSSS
ncbi:MAG: recombinase family protein [Nitrosomonas ureae]